MTKMFAQVFGIVFVLVGAFGFFANPLVGEGGFFHTNWQHDVFHALTGIVFLTVTFFAAQKSGITLNALGTVYIAIGILGFVLVSAPNLAQLFGFITINAADNWLHIALGVAMLTLAFFGKSKGDAPISA